MTDSPTWLAYVEAMVAKAQANQDDIFYRLSLPGWQAELARLQEESNGRDHSDLCPALESGQL